MNEGDYKDEEHEGKDEEERRRKERRARRRRRRRRVGPQEKLVDSAQHHLSLNALGGESILTFSPQATHQCRSISS